MTMNLFSIFDPSSSIWSLSLNWMSVMLFYFFLPFSYWVYKSRWIFTFSSFFMWLLKELVSNVKKSKFEILMFLVGMFMFILVNNFMGLFPMTFTGSSHLVFSLSMALPVWVSFLIYGYKNKMWEVLAHMLPMSTPVGLSPFMVLVETVSMLIRPVSLSVRLTANMVAGHLLMSLMGGLGFSIMSFFQIPYMISFSLLLILEVAVSVIQAYVFVVLVSLYFADMS